MDPMQTDPLLALARAARDRAYAPYSNFRVGAVVLTRDGRRYNGCNVENAAYGLSHCAERTALCSAVADGVAAGQIACIAVIGDCEGPISPCGACRQVMAELCDADTPVLMANLAGERRDTTVGALLPGSFRLPQPA